MTWRKREIADEAHSNRTTMNIYTSETEYLKTQVQRLSALVRAQQITIDKLEAQQEQEPVWWMSEDGEKAISTTDMLNYPDYEYRYSIPLYTTQPQRTDQEQQIETLKRCLFQMQEAAKSLTSPQRTWVSLTDSEWSDLYEAHHDKYNLPKQGSPDGRDYERAIEAKLRSKNEH